MCASAVPDLPSLSLFWASCSFVILPLTSHLSFPSPVPYLSLADGREHLTACAHAYIYEHYHMRKDMCGFGVNVLSFSSPLLSFKIASHSVVRQTSFEILVILLTKPSKG